MKLKNKYIVNVLGGEALNFDEIYDEYSKYGEKLKPFVRDTSVRVYNEIKEDSLKLKDFYSVKNVAKLWDKYYKDIYNKYPNKHW